MKEEWPQVVTCQSREERAEPGEDERRVVPGVGAMPYCTGCEGCYGRPEARLLVFGCYALIDCFPQPNISTDVP